MKFFFKGEVENKMLENHENGKYVYLEVSFLHKMLMSVKYTYGFLRMRTM